MKHLKMSIAASIAALGMAIATPALADPPRHAQAHGYYKKNKQVKKSAYRSGYRDGQRSAQRLGADSRVWRGNDGRYYCKRDNGTTGLIIGGAVGGVAGHEIAGRGDKTLGAILGAAGGALLGRELDRDKYSCR